MIFPTMTSKKNNYGSDGLVISDVIEIKPGESLLGADLTPLAASGDGWISIANRGENTKYLHITKDSILLSLRDLDSLESVDGETPNESLETPQHLISFVRTSYFLSNTSPV